MKAASVGMMGCMYPVAWIVWSRSNDGWMAGSYDNNRSTWCDVDMPACMYPGDVDDGRRTG